MPSAHDGGHFGPAEPWPARGPTYGRAWNGGRRREHLLWAFLTQPAADERLHSPPFAAREHDRPDAGTASYSGLLIRAAVDRLGPNRSWSGLCPCGNDLFVPRTRTGVMRDALRTIAPAHEAGAGDGRAASDRWLLTRYERAIAVRAERAQHALGARAESVAKLLVPSTGQRLSRKEHLMKSPTVAVVLAIILAFAVVGVCAFATADTRVAPKSAVVAAGFAAILGLRSSVGDTVEGRVAGHPSSRETGSTSGAGGPAALSKRLGDPGSSVDDLLDRSRRAMQERTYL